MKDTKKKKKKKRSPATKSDCKSTPWKGEEKSSQCGYNIEKRPSVMASLEQQVPARTSPAANVVGNAFVELYYHMLIESPELVHRFYHDSSKLGRLENNGIMGITSTMKDIQEKILSVSYGELSAEIISVDAQESYGGGVLVLVIGFMIGKDNMRQKFTQCFFLAPQEKGYYVLNDVFRCVDENGNQGSVHGGEEKSSQCRYNIEKGKEQTKLAQKADAKASHDIFIARNKGIENVITIDLHGQLVKPAMRMLKLHILFGSYVPSVQTLRVITGYGSHSGGKSKLKQSVINLLEKEAIEWIEENWGTVLIKLDGYREFSFLDSDSDSDSDNN